jgi:hypothetical protein
MQGVLLTSLCQLAAKHGLRACARIKLRFFRRRTFQPGANRSNNCGFFGALAVIAATLPSVGCRDVQSRSSSQQALDAKYTVDLSKLPKSVNHLDQVYGLDGCVKFSDVQFRSNVLRGN